MLFMEFGGGIEFGGAGLVKMPIDSAGMLDKILEPPVLARDLAGRLTASCASMACKKCQARDKSSKTTKNEISNKTIPVDRAFNMIST